MANVRVADARVCTLGEGPLWHPLREQLFWFDIVGKKLLTRVDASPEYWSFEEPFSAAGWIDRDTLLMAGESGLYRFNLNTAEQTLVCSVEADNPRTRSNDGRADPYGGFWFGTMHKDPSAGPGAIYRYFDGELRVVVPRITVPNAICFSRDGRYVYYGDTAGFAIYRMALDTKEGWPCEAAEPFIDTSRCGLHPDGAVIDGAGQLWNAHWGGAAVSCYSPEGVLQHRIHFPTSQTTCPAFGGAGLTTLFVTTATESLSQAERVRQTDAGALWCLDVESPGVAEPAVKV